MNENNETNPPPLPDDGPSTDRIDPPVGTGSPPESTVAPTYEPAPSSAEATPAPIEVPTSTAPGEPQRSGPSTGAVVMIAIAVTLVFGTIIGGTAGFAGGWLATHGSEGEATGGTIRVVSDETNEPVSAAAAAALPSVVNIDISGEIISEDDSGELPEGHPGVPSTGNGSGVALYHDGDGGTYIITNAHVVDDASSIVVTGSDRERHRAELIGTDPETDIAVVRIDIEMPLVEIGDSEALIVGQVVVAIGSPYGLSHSVSSGVVSALGRSLPNSVAAPSGVYPLVDVIQTDAAINPGNSGGALVNREGALVGINSAIYSDTGASGGIGFAVPVNRAIRVADELIESGDVKHPFLGILGRDVDVLLAEEEGLPVEEGAYIVEVTEGTEAEKAGLTTGDVVVALDDYAILSMDDLILEVRRKRVGDTVTVTVYREGERLDIEMKVGDKPETVEIPDEEPVE